MHVQTLLSKPAIEAFDLRLVGRFAGTTEIQFDAALISPFVHGLRNELVSRKVGQCLPAPVQAILYQAMNWKACVGSLPG